jgi:hypothetical protein
MGVRYRLRGTAGRGALVRALGAGVCAAPLAALLPAAPAWAQAQPAPPPARPKAPPKPAGQTDADTEVSEVVVSGAPTLYRNQPGAVIGDIEPDLQLSPADIQSYGVSSVTELLSELAPQTQSDQGRGGGSPVVLLNGRRISGFNEVQNIPTEAILRVDILPEEVALKYGFTADQKVVNIVLRRRFRSITAEATGGGPTEGGQVSGSAEGDQFRVRGDNRLNLDVQYSGSSDLTAAARGLNQSTSSQPYSVAGNVVPAQGMTQIDPALSALAGKTVTVAGVPALPVGRNLLLSDFLPTANLANAGSVGQYRDLSPATQSVTANGVLARTLPWGLSGTINGTLGATSSESMQGLPSLALMVPAGNAFSPFSETVGVDRYVNGLGPLTQTATGWTAHLGGTLNKDLGGWRLNFTTAYDHGDSLTVSSTGINAAPLQSLLTLGSTSFNPFAPIPAGMLSMSPLTEARSFSDSGNVQIVANGPVIKGPAGALFASLKVGDTESAFRSQSERMAVDQSIYLTRNDFNAQANLDLPIASRRNHVLSPVGELTLNLHLAIDELSDFGALRSLGYGLNWQPITQVKLIVSNTRDQAAPTVQQIGNPTVSTPGAPVFDYATGQSVTVTQITGANPRLTSDRRDVFKVGLTIKPISSQDLTITANYIDSHVDNPIQTFPAATAQIEAAFPDRFIRDAEGELTEENLTPVNFDYQERRDIRWGINYSRPVGRQPPPRPPGGRFRPDGAGRFRPPPGQPQAGQPPTNPGQITELPGAPPPEGPPSGPPPGAQVEGGPPRPGPDGGPPPGFGSVGGAGRGGGFGGGGRGGGGFGGPGAGGRFQVAIYHTIYFTDQSLVRPGGPLLNLLNGAAAGSTGGQPIQSVQAQMGYTLNGWGARASANWQSATTVDSGAASPTGTLTFSDLATVNLRLFANFGQMRALVMRHRWLRGSRLTINITDLTDARLHVRDSAGLTPISYAPAYLSPAGRTVSLSLRKLFF